MQQRIPTLDSLRGLAALLVVFHHAFSHFPNCFPQPPGHTGNLLQIISELNVAAVLFFFFLSGYSIALSLKGNSPTQPTTANQYFYRRFRRIIPLYLLTLLITMAGGLITQHWNQLPDYSIKQLIGNLAFLQCSASYKGNWFLPYGENGPLWSLSFEMWYYLSLPLILWLFEKKLRLQSDSNAALILVLVISLLAALVNKLIFIPWIAFASLYVVWFAGYRTALKLKNEPNKHSNLFWMLGITSVVALLDYNVSSATIHKLFIGLLLGSIFSVINLLHQMKPRWLHYPQKILNTIFQTTGRGSYALYLLHFPVLMVLKHLNPNSPILLFGVLTLVLFSSVYLENWFVRQPFQIFHRTYIPEK